MKFSTSLLAVSAVLITPCLAFLRTAPAVSPLTYNYTLYGPVPNITDIITYDESTGIKSYWWANFLVGENGHEYCLVLTSANAGPGQMITSISYTDITLGSVFGESWITNGSLSTTIFEGISPYLHVGAYTEDQFSESFAISSVAAAEFNITYTPQGPPLYQGASGCFIWGSGLEYAFDVPQTAVSGTLGSGPNMTNIVSSESMTWFDLQWGPGYVAGGWQDFVVILDNGIMMQVTISVPDVRYKQGSYANVAFPDGHQEMWPVVPNSYPSTPWVSDVTNITYYQNYEIHIPYANVYLNATAPVQCGETPNLADPSPSTALADTFVYYEGTWDGLYVKGQGIAEHRVADMCTVYGAANC